MNKVEVRISISYPGGAAVLPNRIAARARVGLERVCVRSNPAHLHTRDLGAENGKKGNVREGGRGSSER